MIEVLNIDITNKCINRCRGCYKVSGEETGWMGFEVLEKVFKEAKEMGCDACGFSGGEPAVEKQRLIKCVELGKKYFRGVGVLTTGYDLLNWFPQVADKVNFMHISLDGDREYHNWYRRNPNAFDYAMTAIRWLSEHWVKGRNILRVNMVLTNKNIDQLPFILKVAQDYPIQLRISPLVPLGNGKEFENLVPDPIDVALALGKIEKYFMDNPKPVKLANPHDRGEQKLIDLQFGLTKYKPGAPFNCPSGIDGTGNKTLGKYPVVSETGDVKICSYMPMIAGNVKKKSFKEIYNHPENYDEYFITKPLNKVCANCLMRGVCVQACRATAYMKDGVFDYDKEPPKWCVLRKQGLLEKRKQELCLQPK